MTEGLLAAVLVSTVVSYFLQPLVRRHLVRLDVVDRPNHRSSHRIPVPRGGGIGIAAGLLAGTATFAVVASATWLLLVLCVVIVGFGLVGLRDDRTGISAGGRLLSQFMLSVTAMLVLATMDEGSRGLTTFGILAAIAMGIVWVPAYVNAFNFMDGIDGIAASHAAVVGAYLACVALRGDAVEPGVLAAVVAGACLGFLPWNLPSARLFMGDVGSYATGGALALAAAWLCWTGTPVLLCLAPFAVFLADTGVALARRLAGGRPWREAHREHVYQRLVDGGWSHLATTMFATAATVVICAAALLGDAWSWPWHLLAATALAIYMVSAPVTTRLSAAPAHSGPAT